MHTRSVWKWFAVKSVFRVAATGRPLGRDEALDPAMTLVEERVVLFRARSHDEAIARADEEARAYCGEAPHRNPYGQRVVYRRLPQSDCFELFESPASGREVYSRTEVAPRSVSDRAVVAALLGPGESRRVAASRRNVLDIAFDAPAGGVARTEEESALNRRVRTGTHRAPSRKKAPVKGASTQASPTAADTCCRPPP